MNCSSILEDDIISIMCVPFDCQNLFPGLFCKLHVIKQTFLVFIHQEQEIFIHGHSFVCCKKVECTFLLINQLRENIGNPYKPFKIPCGTAIAHACSQILWFTKGSLLDEKYKEVSSGYANPSGNLVSVKVEKNKVTKNDRRLQTYTLNYSTGVDEIKDTLDLAIMLGIISQAGAWFKATLKDGKEQKMQGFNGVQEFYYNDLEELEHLRKQVYEAGMA